MLRYTSTAYLVQYYLEELRTSNRMMKTHWASRINAIQHFFFSD